MRREISVGNVAKFEEYTGIVIELFGSMPEDELMNLLGR